jgi:hypothetical protein
MYVTYLLPQPQIYHVILVYEGQLDKEIPWALVRLFCFLVAIMWVDTWHCDYTCVVVFCHMHYRPVFCPGAARVASKHGHNLIEGFWWSARVGCIYFFRKNVCHECSVQFSLRSWLHAYRLLDLCIGRLAWWWSALMNGCHASVSEKFWYLWHVSSSCTDTSSCALFAWLISHQPAVLLSRNKPATSQWRIQDSDVGGAEHLLLLDTRKTSFIAKKF